MWKLVSLAFLLMGMCDAQFHGYQNPYQYHPYMRYHSYDKSDMTPKTPASTTSIRPSVTPNPVHVSRPYQHQQPSYQEATAPAASPLYAYRQPNYNRPHTYGQRKQPFTAFNTYKRPESAQTYHQDPQMYHPESQMYHQDPHMKHHEDMYPMQHEPEMNDAYQRHYHHRQQQQPPYHQHSTPRPSAYEPRHYNAYQQPHHQQYQQPTKAAKALHKPNKKEETPKYLGSFKNAKNLVEGDIFMLDDHTLYIQGFSFDGQAPDVYFWSDGVPIPYYTRSDPHIAMNVHEFHKEDIVLMLPPEKPTLEQLKHFMIWCKQYGINFGEFSVDKA